MPRPKTGDKRAAILRAATKAIAEDGIKRVQHIWNAYVTWGIESPADVT